MRFASCLVFISSVVLSSGCAVKQAQTAQEFRLLTPQIGYVDHETVTVDQSYPTVVNNFQKRADKCLTVELLMTTTNRYGQTVNEQTLSYTPTLVAGKAKSELSLQKNVSGGGMIMGKVPEKGMYILVADMTPAGKHKTRLDIYRNTYETDIIVAAVKNWASGKSLACPDWPR